MKKVIQFSVTNEDGMYVASGVNAPIVTDGKTFEELEKNIGEAVSLYLEEMVDETENSFVKNPAVVANFEFNIPSYA
ncbi:MAG: type II toxin-antitoxin system HicB family antitoxin [Candidatus Paceibacterota bacterium]